MARTGIRSTVVIVALLLFAGEGFCTTLCAPEPARAEASDAAARPSCHATGQPAQAPEAPPEEHECSGPCDASLTAASPELPSQAAHAALALPPATPAERALRSPAQAFPEAERLPPTPARFLLHASFLI